MSNLDITTPTAVGEDFNTSTGASNAGHLISTYVSDMLALERHIAEPVGRQTDMKDTSQYGDASTLIARIKDVNEAHIAALDRLLDNLGGHEAEAVKSAWSAVLGFGAAAIDSVRKTKVSKSLRDDSTALNLASTSYTMLLATAAGLGETETADIAQQHLADYARLVIEISHAIPDVVLQELRDDGQAVQADAADNIRRRTAEVWQQQAHGSAG